METTYATGATFNVSSRDQASNKDALERKRLSTGERELKNGRIIP
jgi:hypothetical protein